MTEVVAGTESTQGIRTAGIRARLALEAGKMVSWEWNIQADEVIADQGLFDLFGLKPQALTSADIFKAIHADDLPLVQEHVDVALASSADYVTEFRVLLPDGRHRWIGARGAVTARGHDGTPLRMLGINWDKTEQKAQEERLSIVAAEMNHRVENAFAVIGALVQIGARAEGDKESYATRLRSQIQALAASHRLSVEAAKRPDDDDVVLDASDIIRSALGAWSAEDADGTGSEQNQVTTAFRTVAGLKPRQGAALAMLTYELTTNALKYGALSTPTGHLTVTLDTAPDGCATLRWIERSDTVVAAAKPSGNEERGFGSVLMEYCSRALRGSIVKNDTDGCISVQITFPIVRTKDEVQEEALKMGQFESRQQSA